jgi:transcriptional regulator with XRE-family HTH domain
VTGFCTFRRCRLLGILLVMLVIRVTGNKLQFARRLLGWSRQELARRSTVNWRTLRAYESSGDHPPPATVAALTRLIDALEAAGIEFRGDGVFLERATPLGRKAIHAEVRA